MTQAQTQKSELELLDEDVFAAPERLSPQDCFDQLGGDWRWPSAFSDAEGE